MVTQIIFLQAQRNQSKMLLKLFVQKEFMLDLDAIFSLYFSHFIIRLNLEFY